MSTLKAEIRLTCTICGTEEYDGITESDLGALIMDGWTDIYIEQTYEQSIKTYENPKDAPDGFSALIWYTHTGICPKCKEQS